LVEDGLKKRGKKGNPEEGKKAKTKITEESGAYSLRLLKKRRLLVQIANWDITESENAGGGEKITAGAGWPLVWGVGKGHRGEM